MGIDELRAALAESVARGTLGGPIALRIYVQLSDRNVSLEEVWMLVLNIANSALPDHRPARLFAQAIQNGTNGRQLSALVSCIGGETLSITIGIGSAARPALDLVLVGNRGIVRLEGGELLMAGPSASWGGVPRATSGPYLWDVVERSLDANATLGISE